MLIGLTGYAGVGKDTVANILRARHGYKRYAFADKLKSFVYELNPLIIAKDPDDILVHLRDAVDEYGWDFVKRAYPLARHYLQKTGVWFRENVDKNYWVNVVAERWYADGCPNAVFTDVRFPNEVAWIRSAGGVVIRVHRPGVGPVNDHESERADELGSDWELNNDGTTEDLERLVDVTLRVAEWKRSVNDTQGGHGG